MLRVKQLIKKGFVPPKAGKTCKTLKLAYQVHYAKVAKRIMSEPPE